MNAWIDCLTYEDDGMTAYPVQPGEVLTLQLLECREFRARCPEIYEARIDSAAFVNWRRIELRRPADPRALLPLSPTESRGRRLGWTGYMAALRHDEPGWDMHDHGAELARAKHDRLSEGAQVSGIVVCHHHYGLGIYIPDRDEYGHVNIPFVGPGRLRGPQDFPPIGAEVNATVFGYTGIDAQLRLWIHRPEQAAQST